MHSITENVYRQIILQVFLIYLLLFHTVYKKNLPCEFYLLNSSSISYSYWLSIKVKLGETVLLICKCKKVWDVTNYNLHSKWFQIMEVQVIIEFTSSRQFQIYFYFHGQVGYLCKTFSDLCITKIYLVWVIYC